MEVVDGDARDVRDRALVAMEGCADLEDRRAFWRIALTFNRRMREEGSAAQVRESRSLPLSVMTGRSDGGDGW